MNSQELDSYIHSQSESIDTFETRLKQTALDSLGTAYHDGPLGEGPKGTNDTDPLVDFSRADCVTFVEQSIAVAATPNYDAMFALLQNIRYKNGEIGYEPRNHFFISDWIANNPFCTEITRDLGVPTTPITRTISRRYFFDLVKAPEFGRDTRDQEITLHVIPPEHVADAVPNIPATALVVFVGNVNWLFSLHCGLHIRDTPDGPRLFHASSKAGKVIAMPLEEYVQEQGDRYAGIAVFNIAKPNIE